MRRVISASVFCLVTACTSEAPELKAERLAFTRLAEQWDRMEALADSCSKASGLDALRVRQAEAAAECKQDHDAAIEAERIYLGGQPGAISPGEYIAAMERRKNSAACAETAKMEARDLMQAVESCADKEYGQLEAEYDLRKEEALVACKKCGTKARCEANLERNEKLIKLKVVRKYPAAARMLPGRLKVKDWADSERIHGSAIAFGCAK